MASQSKKLVSKSPLLAIVIPMYNEAVGAAKCIDSVMKYITNFSNIILIIVNDGSHDKTKSILEKKALRYQNKIRIVSHEINRGYGAALRSGINESITQHADFILFMDSDLTNDPKFIIDFVTHMESKIDCVKASRHIQGGRMVGVPLYRVLISILGNTVARICFRMNIRDCTNGFRMVKLSTAKKIPYSQNNFSIILEELYYLKKMHANVIEIPTTLTSRKKTKSHFSYSPKLLGDYLFYAVKAFFI